MFNFKAKQLLTRDVGIDLGTTSVIVCVDSKGIVIREPSVVAVNRDTDMIEKIGKEAQAMLGRSPANIEVVRPVNTPKVNNPDIFIAGSLWEMKAPISYNENTLKKHFKKASKQSDKVIFDLRNAKQDATKIEKFVIKKYQEPGRIRRMILIQANGRVLDFFK